MRFGLGWRSAIGAGILANRQRIDVVEVMAEDFAEADPATRRALRFLGAQVPIVVHATSLGLASSERVDRRKLDAIARVVGWLEPDFWSEHLAFVRASGVEIGHLAAPPRNAATLDGLRRNVDLARQVVGTAPLLENVATLVEPPLSDYDEAEWLCAVDSDLLLDLHNLHANATNFGFDAVDILARIPHERVRAVHLAGGRRIERDRILDDHLHEVPDPVYELLAYVGNEEATVILERDGNYPPVEDLLAELDRARTVSRRPLHSRAAVPAVAARPGIDAFLARLYVDEGMRTRFLDAPYRVAMESGLDEASARDLAATSKEDLLLAARGFERKRDGRPPAAGATGPGPRWLA
jgi:hypothetical protein